MEEIFYAPDGSTITRRDALALMKDFESRTVKRTELTLASKRVLVCTVFVPIDMCVETCGTLTKMPACWVTEIIGGPDDLNGVIEYSMSRDEALDVHELVVERACTSGCVERTF